MDLQDIFHWLYVGGMALGAIYLASLGRNPRGVPRYEYFVATFIPIWSGLAIIPFFSKVGFSVLDLHGLRNLHHHSVQTPADRAAENLLHFMGNMMTFKQPKRLPSRRRA